MITAIKKLLHMYIDPEHIGTLFVPRINFVQFPNKHSCESERPNPTDLYGRTSTGLNEKAVLTLNRFLS